MGGQQLIIVSHDTIEHTKTIRLRYSVDELEEDWAWKVKDDICDCLPGDHFCEMANENGVATLDVYGFSTIDG